jgi:hypothetical protein
MNTEKERRDMKKGGRRGDIQQGPKKIPQEAREREK